MRLILISSRRLEVFQTRRDTASIHNDTGVESGPPVAGRVINKEFEKDDGTENTSLHNKKSRSEILSAIG